MRFKVWTRRLFSLLLLTGAAVLLINAAVYIPARGHMVAPESTQPADAILVLGAQVFADGRVSQMVADRLETAYQLYRAKKAPKLLVSGDHGTVGYDEVNTMRRYLEEKGVPTEDIFMDHAGFNTYNSMYRARAIFGLESAIVVTQRFHLPRAVWLAQRMGIATQGVAADRHRYAGAWYYEVRELGARLKAFADVVLTRRPVFLGPAIPITGDGRQTHDLLH